MFLLEAFNRLSLCNLISGYNFERLYHVSAKYLHSAMQAGKRIWFFYTIGYNQALSKQEWAGVKIQEVMLPPVQTVDFAEHVNGVWSCRGRTLWQTLGWLLGRSVTWEAPARMSQADPLLQSPVSLFLLFPSSASLQFPPAQTSNLLNVMTCGNL